MKLSGFLIVLYNSLASGFNADREMCYREYPNYYSFLELNCNDIKYTATGTNSNVGSGVTTQIMHRKCATFASYNIFNGRRKTH